MKVRRAMKTNNLLKYKKNIFSQFGEDGVIGKIFSGIGIKYGVCCEFGAWDGIHLSNCRNLVLNGWSCIFIEADEAKWRNLVKNYEGFTNVHCINKLVDDENNKISNILNELHITELDFLSIDIDGLDYEIFESLDIYPRVICIEVQGGHSPESTTKLPRDIAIKNIGQPLTFFVQIAREKGYSLVCYTGNAFFIKNTEIESSSLLELTAVEAYTECLNYLDEKLRVWLYFANIGLVEPYFVFNNPYLNFAINPSDPEVNRLVNQALQLALVYHKAGNLQQAEYVYRKILDIQPNNSYALNHLGNVYKEDERQFGDDVSCLKKSPQLERSPETDLQEDYNFSLDGEGERVDIIYSGNVIFDELDMYQKSHYRRYEFAKDIIPFGSCCGDFACGTGYGSVMIADKAAKVIGADINSTVIDAIKFRYHRISNVEFICKNLLDLEYEAFFDTIVSFETIEHLAENDIPRLLRIYYKALKPQGKIIFSVPYMQELSEAAMKLGFHLTFYIDEAKIKNWLKTAGFEIESFKYQNYETHTIQDELLKKDFIICIARKQDHTRKTGLEEYISELTREREVHIQEITSLKRDLTTLHAEIEKHVLIPKQGLTYAQDLLFTYHNADFMKDPLFIETYNLVKEIDAGHLLKDYDIQWRIHVLCWAASHAKNLEGDFVDCGVSTGLFARGVIHYVDFPKLNKKYYLLDTFCGMDPRYSSPYEMQRNEIIGYGKRKGVYEKVKETFAGFNVEIIKGAIPDTLSQVKTEKVCYLSIDMNCVLPEIAALEFFWDKMVGGGVIILDDYGYPGCIEQKIAHDAFAKSKNVQVLSLPTCQGMIIKPYAQKQDGDIGVACFREKLEKPLLVSVAIPCYEMHGRGAEFLDFSLSKIHQQTYKNIEVIISDHSQGDDIENICKKWGNSLDIKYFRNETKRGKSSANLNNAIIHCNGDLIKILFQDDFLFSETSIEEIVDLFNRNPKSYWLITASEHSDDGFNFKRPFDPHYNENIHLGNNTISSPSVLTIRNKDVLLLDENLIWLMDCDYYKRLHEKFGEPLILNKINVVNRTWDSQLSNIISEELKKKEYDYVKEKYKSIHLASLPEVEFTEEAHLLAILQKDFRNVPALISLAEIELERSDHKKAQKYLIAALAIEPQNSKAKTLWEKLQQ
jgi:O-methyltransferase